MPDCSLPSSAQYPDSQFETPEAYAKPAVVDVLALILVAKTPIQSFAGNQNQRKDESGAGWHLTG
jgi:hypothetical protein